MDSIKHQTTKPQIGEFVCVLHEGVPMCFDNMDNTVKGLSAFGKVIKVGRKIVTVEGVTGNIQKVYLGGHVFGFTSDMDEVDAYGSAQKSPWTHEAYKF